MQIFIRNILFVLSASNLASTRHLQKRADDVEPLIELPDGEIGDWAPGHTAITTLTGSAKSSAIIAIDTGKAVIQASAATSILQAATSSAASASSYSAAVVAVQAAELEPAHANPSSTPTPTPTPAPLTHSAVATQALSSVLSSETQEAATLTTATIAPTAIAVTTPAPQVDLPAGAMTISITNKWPSPLSISYLNNFGSPSAIGDPAPAPLGTATAVVYPTGWAGRINIGSLAHSADTKIEGSSTGANDIDVSLVDGFSVPITCSVGDTPVTGCNINLWSVSGPCTNPVGSGGADAVCLNPMQGVADGPADNWFLPCQGAAYTFPNDNIANDGNTGTGIISCCVGTEAQGCAAPARQGHGNNVASKRAVEVVMHAGAKELDGRNETDEGTKSGVGMNVGEHLRRHLQWRRGGRTGHWIARGLKDVV